MMTTVRRIPHIIAIGCLVLLLSAVAFAVISMIRSDLAKSFLLPYR
jgi:hypothetical protein